jgi:hypothetical protein
MHMKDDYPISLRLLTNSEFLLLSIAAGAVFMTSESNNMEASCSIVKFRNQICYVELPSLVIDYHGWERIICQPGR